MSRRPPITPLLNGHAVKVRLVSTSVTAMRGSCFLSARAALAPANPPPTTTTRGAAWASAGAAIRPAVAAVEARNSRRLKCLGDMAGLLLLGVPGGDRRDLGVAVALGDAVHHGRRLRAGPERLHLRDDLGRVA